MIFKMCELILKQEKNLKQKKIMDRVCKILDENDIDASWSSLNS